MIVVLLDMLACTGGSAVVDDADERGHDTDPWQLDGDTGQAPELAIDLVDPPTGSTSGGELARVLGGPLDIDGESPAVTLGGAEGKVTAWTATAVEFITPPGAAGPAVVTLAQGEARVSASGLFAYDDGCDGITTIEPDPFEGDANEVEAFTVTILGCATGIVLVDERGRESGEIENYYEVRDYPPSVDGQDEVKLWHQANGDLVGTVEWSFIFDTDQGQFAITMELEGDGR